MALPRPGEAAPPDKVCYAPESSPQNLAAYYTPFPAYGHYRNGLATAEEDFQPFRQLEAAASAAPAMPPFAFRMAPPVLSPSLGLQREPLYDLSWYGKLPPWYPIPHVPREVPPFLGCSREYMGASGEDLGHQIIGGPNESDPCCGPETFIPPPPVDASPLPDGLRTSQALPCSPRKQSEDGPKPSNQEGTSPARFHFTEEDLHFVLYGTTPSLEHPASLQHAISGLLVPTDSSGKGSPHHLGVELDGNAGGSGNGKEALPGGAECIECEGERYLHESQGPLGSLLRPCLLNCMTKVGFSES
ncbi:PR domain zinc finger protein 14 [Saguinus oedipus]|uniref:PR domain zinc finger protein 14 n=1 Tax=Saguinus oedipus TaxID=9490 RepID=A0ABQ9UF15_SAGOE|nr:PR domain zinc finger protein 14 [Saguinus oedipus]